MTGVGSLRADWCSTVAVDTVPVDWGPGTRWTLVLSWWWTRDAWLRNGKKGKGRDRMQDDVSEGPFSAGRNADRGSSRRRKERKKKTRRLGQGTAPRRCDHLIRLFSSSRRVICKASIASWSMEPGLDRQV